MDTFRELAALDDGAVILLARAGDKAAYSELVRRNQSWIRNLLRRLCGNAALALLSEPERLCIVLCYHEGLSHAEVAELAALPLGTVKSHIGRGRQKLQDCLAAYRAEPISGDKHD